MQIDKKKVGERIFEIRQQSGYSMEQFGKQIGDAPRGSVNSWEKGVNLPNKERLEMIAVMGNMSVDELLYGSFEDYITELIYNNLGIKISYQFTRPFAMQLKIKGFTYGDDVEILRFAKGFFNVNKIPTLRPSLFYELISAQDSLFIGYLEIGEDTTVPKFFVRSDTEKNILHVMPFLLNDSLKENYAYSPSIAEPGGHDYFTSGLNALQMRLRDIKLVYYGLDISEFTPNISIFSYDAETDALFLDAQAINPENLYLPFIDCVKKEALFLGFCAQK